MEVILYRSINGDPRLGSGVEFKSEIVETTVSWAFASSWKSPHKTSSVFATLSTDLLCSGSVWIWAEKFAPPRDFLNVGTKRNMSLFLRELSKKTPTTKITNKPRQKGSKDKMNYDLKVQQFSDKCSHESLWDTTDISKDPNALLSLFGHCKDLTIHTFVLFCVMW